MDNKFILKEVIHTLFKPIFSPRSLDMTEEKFWLMKSERD